jgi:methionine synthase II (cobalamin-independent)
VTREQKPPFRAEHIGSLVRPAHLLKARDEFALGRIDAAQLRAIEDGAILDAVRMQEDLGLEVITDGEFRRGTYSDSFTTSGISGVATIMTEENQGFAPDKTHGHRMARRIPRVVERIRWKGPDNARNLQFLKSLTGKTCKVTLPGPAYIHYRAGRANISREAYPDLDDYWSDLVHAYHLEMRSLREAGCAYLQLDDTAVVKLGDPLVQQLLRERGDDWEVLLDTYIDVINRVVAGLPDGMTVGIHLCRSGQVEWQSTTGYDPIADKLFNALNIDIFFLEYDSGRCGTFEPLSLVPKGKTIVLGLVGSRTAELESKKFLESRIEEASRYIDIDQLAISPKCGFSTGVFEDKDRSINLQWEKLALVVTAADAIWGSHGAVRSN